MDEDTLDGSGANWVTVEGVNRENQGIIEMQQPPSLGSRWLS